MDARTAWFLLLVMMGVCAKAAPPPGTDMDSKMHLWFEMQHNIKGSWCCNLGDGHVLEENEWRAKNGYFQVMISGQWRDIEHWMWRDPKGGPNPTGKAIVWFQYTQWGLQIYCFTPGSLF